jgi:hypothetical protein
MPPSKKAPTAETSEQVAMRLLEREMDALRDRVVKAEMKARRHARNLPNGETRLYVSYLRTLMDRLGAAFEAGADIPYFGTAISTSDPDEDE